MTTVTHSAFNDLFSVDLISKGLFAVIVLLITVLLANLAAALIKRYSQKLETALPVSSLTQHIAKIAVYSIGALIILNSFGVSITPILATLGVGGLAVALALQDTLSNLFAGFYIVIARQIKIGDYIKLESGQEGYVTDIDWRTTKIKMLPNNVVLVPNTKLTQAIITNYDLPDRRVAFSVELSVHYDTNLAGAEHIAAEVAREVMHDVKDGVPDFTPSVQYTSFGDSGIGMSVSLMAREFAGQAVIKHEFIKRLHERFRKERIVIPYPVRAINYSQEKAQQ
ncbi:MAG: mechanosensitive ion channel family protein [Candidatus Omnitrophota bacterium]